MTGEYTITATTTFSCSLEIGEDCVTYTALPLFEGDDVVEITACDADGNCEVAYAYITVGNCNGEENEAPVAVDDMVASLDGETVCISVLDNDFDNDADDTFTIGSFTQPLHGTITQNGNSFCYTPDANYEGFDSFAYQICDEAGDCDFATVTVEVEQTCEEITFICAEPIQPLMICPSFCSLTGNVSITDAHTTYNCSLDFPEGNDACIQYTALPLFVGEETITITGCNEFGMCETIEITVNVTDDCSDNGTQMDNNGGKLVDETNTLDAQASLVMGQILPVPADNFVDVYFLSATENVTIEVTDLTGRILTSQTLATEKGANNTRLDIADYAAGIYLVTIRTQEEAVNAKFVKQ